MITFYEFPPTRSDRAKWALEELGLSYDSRAVNLMKGENLSQEYRQHNPLGVVPALATDTYSMFESVAIVMQLIDEHPAAGLAPLPGTPERAAYYQWCVFAAGELDGALMMYWDNSARPLVAMRPPGRQHNAEFAEIGKYLFAERASVLSDALRDRQYLLGESFSGADIAIGQCCGMAARMELLGGYPVLEAYLERLKARLAFSKVYG